MYHNAVEKGRSLPCKMTAPYMQGQRHLLDDSVLEEGSPCGSSEGSLSGVGEQEGDGDQDYSFLRQSMACFRGSMRAPHSTIPQDLYTAQYQCQGCLRRKTLLKNGRKPAVSTWTRYWVALWGTSLLYFPAKSLRGIERESFKSEPCKMTSILGWMVVMGGDTSQPDVFQMTDPDRGNVYKFRSGSQAESLDWCRKISKGTQGERRKEPGNLMSFE
jgi:hypothetical protein